MEEYIFALDTFDPCRTELQAVPNGMHSDIYESYKSSYEKRDKDHTLGTLPLIGFPAHIFGPKKNLSIKFTCYKKIPRNKRYFYPIRISCIRIFFAENIWGNDKSPYWDRPLSVPEKVLKDVRRNICKILLIYDVEGNSLDIAKHPKFIIRQANLLDISTEAILFVDGNNIIKQELAKHSINGYYFNNWEFFNNPLSEGEVKKIIEDIDNKKDRLKKFINFNRKPHFHRVILVNKILNAGLDKDTIVTLADRYNSREISWNHNMFKGYDLDTVKKRVPITYDYEDLVHSNPTKVNFYAQLSAYIDITSETYCISHLNVPDNIFFSEKTFKPILCLQPFIQVNFAHSLKYLKALGYKTFHPYINESYDDELNHHKRLDMVFQEMVRLSKLNNEECKQLLKDLLPILIHNEQNYRNNFYSSNLNFLKEIMSDWNQQSIQYINKEGSYNVAMIGLGKLGKDCAEVMGRKHKVSGYDVKTGITSDTINIVSTVKEAVQDKDIVFIAVPTPHDPLYGGETPTSHLTPKDFDYSIVKDCLKEVHSCTTPDQLIVLISTVLPGTVRKQLIQYLPDRRFIYNPYLIAMGTIKEDMVTPEMLIIGTEDGDSNTDSDELIDFYKTFIKQDTRIVQGTWDEAESIKIFYNTFISAKISLVNMIQDVAEKNGNINVDIVTKALKESTYRIMGPAYMTAGMGDGGACHPRDNIALRYMAQELNLGYDLFGSIMQSREIQAKNLAECCLRYDKDICIVGAAYKPGVPYTQGSYSYLVGFYINQAGGWLSYYDPNTGDNKFETEAKVYLIGYWEKWVEDVAWPDNCTIIDPWRKFKTNNPTIKVVHYGNTR